MAGVSVLQPISESVFALLNVPAIKAPPPAGAGCIGGVTDNPAQARPFPYLWFEVDEVDLSGLGQGPDVKHVTLRLHVFSTAATMAEAQRILRAAGELLRFASLSVEGWLAVPVGRPHDVVPLPFEELNGVKVLELVGRWSIFVQEPAAP